MPGSPVTRRDPGDEASFALQAPIVARLLQSAIAIYEELSYVASYYW